MTPEFHRPVSLDRIGPHGLDLTVEAAPAECSALAVRMSVPAVLAAWYFALHSCVVRACAGAVAENAAKPDNAAAHNNLALIVILGLPGGMAGLMGAWLDPKRPILA